MSNLPALQQVQSLKPPFWLWELLVCFISHSKIIQMGTEPAMHIMTKYWWCSALWSPKVSRLQRWVRQDDRPVRTCTSRSGSMVRRWIRSTLFADALALPASFQHKRVGALPAKPTLARNITCLFRHQCHNKGSLKGRYPC